MPAALLHAPFVAQARRTPDRVAVSGLGWALSYEALDRASDGLARRLAALGVAPEVRVALLVERSAEALVAVLAVLKAGGAYVPLDPEHPPARWAELLAESGARLALSNVPGGAARLRTAGFRVLSLDFVSDPPAILAAGPRFRPSAALSDALAYVLFTSGSTGRPKAVAVSHRAVAFHHRRLLEVCGLDPEDVVLHRTVLGFDSSLNELFAPWAVGARVAVSPPAAQRDAAALLAEMAREGVTVAEVVPALLRVMLDEPGLAALGALRRFQCGGEALAPDLLARFFAAAPPGAGLVNLYGPTEASVEVTWWPAEPPAAGGAAPFRVPIGRPLPGVEVHLLDARLEPVAGGAVGAVFAGGPTLARGYLGRPGLTAERFVPSPAGPPGARLYATGDLARRRPDGVLLFEGRADDQVKVRGFRIEPGEVEAALRAHPEVAEAVVTAPEVAPGDRRLAAYVVAAGGVSAGTGWTARLRDFLAGRLPEPLVPWAFTVLPAIPRLASGKVDRRALPPPDPGSAALRPRYAAPRTPLESELAALVGELVAIDGVGRDDDFFALGGHSLLAVRLLARLRDRYGVSLGHAELFAAPTVAGLAARVAAGGEPGLPAVEPTPRDGRLPAAPAQERILFLRQLEPASLAYQFQEVLTLDGALDPAALAASLSDVVRRHEIYRTTFEPLAADWVQAVHPPAPVTLHRVDLSALPDESRETEARRRIAGQLARLFDVGRLPLVRWTLYRLGRERHLLLHHEHHLVHDGWGFNLFLSELLATYAALAAGRPAPLPVPEVQFADFARLQWRWLEGPQAAAQLAFWRRRLAGCPPLELPTDRPRPPRQSFRGRAFRVVLPPAEVAPLRALGRRDGATLFMVTFAVFLALLHRVSGQSDLAVGTAVGNRRWPRSEGLMGMLVNNVVLRTAVDPAAGFRGLLAAARETALAAWDRQELSFERVVRELRPVRDPSRNPLFQAMFSFHDSALPDCRLPGLAVGIDEETFNGSAKFDLNVIGVPRLEQRLADRGGEEGDAMALLWEYATDLFDGTTMRRMAGWYRSLLAAVAAAPDRPVAELPLLGAAERHQLVVEWNDGGPRPAGPGEPLASFARRAAAEPDRVAIAGGGEALSYGALAAASGALAALLAGRGVGAGAGDAPVGVAVERGPRLLAALLGVLRAGAAYLPLDPGYPRRRLALMIEDSGLRLIVTQRSVAGALPLPPGVETLLLDDAGPERRLRAAIGGGDGMPPPPRRDPGQAAYVLYTSGSTGRPKGVVVPDRALGGFLVALGELIGLGAADVLVATTTLSFDISITELLLPLVTGTRIEIAGRREAADGRLLAERLAACGATALQGTPAMWRLLVDAGWRGDSRFTALTGGEPLTGELAGALAARAGRVWNLYGPTETTVYSTGHRLRPGDGRVRPMPIGRPLANGSVHLLDRGMHPVPAGAAGELWIGGEGLARGYLGRAARTAERFRPDPFAAAAGAAGVRLYRTGDLGRRRADGAVELLGRTDHQVKLRGFRIELGEIEAALAADPEVAEAVAAVAGEGSERRLVAYLVPRAGRRPDLAAVRRRLAGRLPSYMVPAAFAVLAALPRTPADKVDRRALPAAGATAAAAAEYLAPRNEIEEFLAGLWSELTGAARVGVRDNFFDLGGHSLHAARHAHRVRDALGVELPFGALFDAPTVEGLAAVIAERFVAGLDPAAGAAESER